MSATSHPLLTPWRIWSRLALWQQIVTGMALGIVIGIVFGPSATVLKPIGTLFVNAIKMLIVPLVFCSLIVGVTSIKDSQKMGRIGIKAIAFYLISTAIAISLGLLIGTLFEPGAGMDLVAKEQAATKDAPSFINTLVSIVPQNPVAALASGKILQIIVFAAALGVALNLIGEKSQPAVALFSSLAEAMYKLTSMVMKLAPYGVCALMASIAGSYGLAVLEKLMIVIVAVYIGCALHIYGCYGLFISLIGRLNPAPFFKKIIDAQSIAFTSSSSSGTLPVSLRCSEEKLGVPKSISSFVLPLGATINMDGTALYQGVTALFVAQAFGIDLSVADYLTIITTATLASIGTAGVPGAGLIMLTLVLTTVGLPVEGVALIAGIDRILDMARTMVNVSGDLMVTMLISKSEKELNLETYLDGSSAASTSEINNAQPKNEPVNTENTLP
ncbi:dicarboxylate/amino acid:cation symporter [Zooshikella sp. RANM57]|uniref:dicarboxylate/amino acid:cation symporter n=1 Tax=Zooshikella sp. RANM57 TaxID=3425863 RepID=UPI003D6F1F47